MWPSDAGESLETVLSCSCLHEQKPWPPGQSSGNGCLWMQPGKFAERLILHRELQTHWKQHPSFDQCLKPEGSPRNVAGHLVALGWGGGQRTASPCWLPMSWQLGLSAAELEEWNACDPQLCEELGQVGACIWRGKPMSSAALVCPLPGSPIKEQPMCPGGCQEESRAMWAADCFLQLFKNLVTLLKWMLSEASLLAISVCIPVHNNRCHLQTGWLVQPGFRSSRVLSAFMEKKLKRTILLRLRSWFRGKNYIFKLTLAKIRAKRCTAASLTCSFLPSPLSLHKPGLTNRRIDPAEISAKGNKNTSCNLVQGHDMVFHAAAQTCVPTGGTAGEDRESCLCRGLGRRMQGGLFCCFAGLCFFTGWGYKTWLSLGVAVTSHLHQICASWWNLSDPHSFAGMAHMWAPTGHQNGRDGHVATRAAYEKWCVGDAGRFPHPSCPGISLMRQVVSIYCTTVCFRVPLHTEVAQNRLFCACVEKPIQSCGSLLHLHSRPWWGFCRIAPGLEKWRHVETQAVLNRGMQKKVSRHFTCQWLFFPIQNS